MKAVFSVDVERPYPDGEKGAFGYLEILGELGLTATFFVTGDVAETNPELVRAIARAGHEVAAHGYDHPYISHPPGQRSLPLAQRDGREVDKDLRACIDAILAAGVDRPRGFRAPGLRADERTLKAVAGRFAYDSSLLAGSCVAVPQGLRELAVARIRCLGMPAATSLFLGPFFARMLPELAHGPDPLVFYGHSFDLVAPSARLYVSRLKRWWYFDRCGPERAKDIAGLLRRFQAKGLLFAKAAEFVS